MAYAGVTGLGTNDVSNTGTTLVITVGAAVPKGQIVWAGGGASASGALASIADSRGNTWAVDKASAAVRGCGIGSSLINTAALQIGDTITLTFTTSANGNRHGWASTATGNAASAALDKTNTGSNASTAAWNGGATGTLSQADEIVWGTGWRAATGTSTPGGTFTELYDFSATGSTLTAVYLIVAATTTQTPSGTWSGSGNNWEAECASYKALVSVAAVGGETLSLMGV